MTAQQLDAMRWLVLAHRSYWHSLDYSDFVIREDCLYRARQSFPQRSVERIMQTVESVIYRSR